MRRVLTILLFSILAVSWSMAQKATVVSMVETTDFIAGDDQRRDLNKDLCALVKIQVVDEITDVEGNVIGDIVNHGVEKWVYLAKGSKNMKIHLKNNLPVRVLFRDYKIDGLKNNRVYTLVMNVENKNNTNADVTMSGNDLKLKVFPRHATVKIWSDAMQQKAYRPQEDGLINVRLPYGRYYYLVTAKGYHDQEGNTFVNDEHHVETVSLSPVTGTLIVNCPTEKAEFFVSGINKGNSMKRKSSSWRGELPPSSYVVEVCRKGYVSNSKVVKVLANQTTTYDFEPLLTEKMAKKNKRETVAPEETRKLIWKKYLEQIYQNSVNQVNNDAMKREEFIRANAISDVVQMMDGSYIACMVVGSSSSKIMITIDNVKGEIQVPKSEVDYDTTPSK